MRSLLLIAFASLSLAAQDSPAHLALPTRAALDSISARGAKLAAYDRAAHDASDALMKINPAPGSARFYIAAGHSDDWTVYFGNLSPARDTFYIIYSAAKERTDSVYKAGRMPYTNANTGDQLFAARAVATALEFFGNGAHRPYNYAAIRAARAEWWVYLYPAQQTSKSWPLGADVRFRVSSDGGHILERHRMHISVLESPVGDSIEVDGGRLTAYYHSAVVDNRPEDTDVLAVLARQPRYPEFVSVDGGYVYKIDVNGTISLPMKDRPSTSKTGR